MTRYAKTANFVSDPRRRYVSALPVRFEITVDDMASSRKAKRWCLFAPRTLGVRNDVVNRKTIPFSRIEGRRSELGLVGRKSFIARERKGCGEWGG